MKCKRYHHRGKIHHEHIDYRRKKIKNQNFDNYKEIDINLDEFRSIAKRQLNRLFKKAKSTGNHELYKNQIIKLIKNEKMR